MSIDTGSNSIKPGLINIAVNNHDSANIATDKATKSGAQTQSNVIERERSTVTLNQNSRKMLDLENYIKQLPASDPQKVQDTKQKLQSQSFAILSDNLEVRLQQAESLAAKILALDEQFANKS